MSASAGWSPSGFGSDWNDALGESVEATPRGDGASPLHLTALSASFWFRKSSYFLGHERGTIRASESTREPACWLLRVRAARERCCFLFTMREDSRGLSHSARVACLSRFCYLTPKRESFIRRRGLTTSRKTSSWRTWRRTLTPPEELAARSTTTFLALQGRHPGHGNPAQRRLLAGLLSSSSSSSPSSSSLDPKQYLRLQPESLSFRASS